MRRTVLYEKPDKMADGQVSPTKVGLRRVSAVTMVIRVWRLPSRRPFLADHDPSIKLSSRLDKERYRSTDRLNLA